MAIAGTLTYKTELDTSGVKKSGSTVKSIIAGLGITKLISKAMSTINSSLDDAIKRVDTLNNFPKVMSNLGVSAEASSKSINKMSEKLAGLPTTLDQGAMAVQRFTSKNGDVSKSTDIFLALNNAILAGGASTELQANALEQMSQAYAKGKPDMMEWRSIMSAMPAQLNQVAKAMGYGANGADALGEALRQGDVSMDDFMDTIVKLNTKGVDGFQSFEKQAKNSTAGINTAITVAKTQVVKGLADIVNSIDKSLKKSGTSINKIITDLGKKAKEVLDKIAKALSKIDFEKLYNTIKKLVPIITSLVAGFVAYQTTLKVIAGINIAKNIISATSAIVGLTSATQLSSGALAIFNAVMNANPVALLITGITALATAMVLFGNKTSEADKELKKSNETLKEYEDTMKQIDKQRQESLSKSMNEIYYYQSLQEELKGIVDENGKVQDGYEDRANFIVGELNDALGTEIKLTDGIITNYDDIQREIQETLEKKKAMAYFNAHEEEYNEALKKEATLQKEIGKYVDKRDDAEKDLNKTLDQAGKYNEKVAKHKEELLQYYKGEIKYSDLSKEAIEGLNTVTLSHIETLGDASEEYKKYNKEITRASEDYAKNQERIEKYRQAEAELAQGHYDAVRQIFTDTVTFNGKTIESNEKKYEKSKTGWEEYRNFLLENQSQFSKEFLDSEQKRIDTELENLEKEKNEANKQIEEKNKKVLATTITGMNDQLKAMGLKNYEFRDAGNGHVQMYIDGQAQKEPVALGMAQNIVNDVNQKLKDGKYGANEAGQQISNGLAEGISSMTWKAVNSASALVNAVNAKIEEVDKIASPSKVTKQYGKYIVEGMSLGIKENTKDTVKVAGQYAEDVLNAMDINKELEDMYKEINKTIQMENAKLNFDVSSNDIYNKSMQLPAIIDLNANFDGTIPVELNLDGEKIYSNQQKVALRKSVQYGGVK